MRIFAIDPGPEFSGFVDYDVDRESVINTSSKSTFNEVCGYVNNLLSDGFGGKDGFGELDIIAIERVQSYGIAGASLLQTSETVGRFWNFAAERNIGVELIYRREVLKILDVTGKGSRDAIVRQRMLEIHPGGKGTKKNPGPLFGVSGHAWSALAVAVACSHRTFCADV